MSNLDDHAGGRPIGNGTGTDGGQDDATRRDFLYYVTAGAGAVAAGAAGWALIDQMNPSADVQALSSILVDISDVEVGTQLTVKFLGKPVFIRRRTEHEIAESRAVELNQLIDPSAEIAKPRRMAGR